MRLYLYVYPEGIFADRLEGFREESAWICSNEALQFPPHCTVAKGFDSAEAALPAVVGILDELLSSRARKLPVRIGAEAVQTERTDGLGGLLVIEIDIPGLAELAEEWARKVRAQCNGLVIPLQQGGFHLTLANKYELRFASTLLALAKRIVQTNAAAHWRLGIFERRKEEREWILHRSWPLPQEGS